MVYDKRDMQESDSFLHFRSLVGDEQADDTCLRRIKS